MARAAAKPKKPVEPAAVVEDAPAPVEIVAYKGFDRDLKCRGFQYALGETFQHKGRVEACASGFHSCENPIDVLSYYGMRDGNRFAVVRASGKLERHSGDSKIASASLHIEAELKLPEFIRAIAQWIVGAAKENTATGDRGHAAATGDRGHAAATGDRGHAAATGDSGHAAATGDSGHAAATGDSGHAAATGDSGHAAATGDRGHAAATGDRGHAAATGKYSVAAAIGPFGTATAGQTGAIMLAHFDTNVWPYKLACVGAFMVGEHGVQPGKTYRLSADGKPVEART